MLKKSRQKNSDVQEKTYAMIYCRVSSEKQRTEGHGLDAQEARCREFSEKKGFTVQENYIYLERATGAGTSEESRVLQMKIIQDIDKYPFRNFVVVVDDLSRIARDTQGYLGFKNKLKTRGVDFKSPNFQFDDTPEGDYIETVVTAGNELQRKVNRRQVIQKQKARLEAGYWSFGAKKGYTMVKDPQHGKLSVPNKESAILKEGLELFAMGTLQRKVDLCKFLVDRGFWKNQYHSAYINKVSEILENPFYMGDIEYSRWEVSRRKGHHQGIISEETYNLIQKRITKNGVARNIRSDISNDFPLRGLLMCAGCGHAITAARTVAKGKFFPYYFCQNGLCEFGKKSVRQKVVEDGFDVLLQTIKLQPKIGDVIQTVFDKVWTEEVKNMEIEESILSKKKAELESKIKRFTDMVCDAKSERLRTVYEKQLEDSVVELELISNIVPVKNIDLAIPYRNALDKAVGLVKNPYSVWKTLSVPEQHQLFFFIFEKKLEYSKKEGYRNDNLPCAVRLFEEFVTSTSLDVDIRGDISKRLTDYLSRFWQYYQMSPRLQNALGNT
jgi:site-specific DNA recombinase